MAYLLRFVQKFQEHDQSAFLELEKNLFSSKNQPWNFRRKTLPALCGREPSNTLIWECEFPSLQAVQDALDLLNRDPRHTELFQQQVQFFVESYVEIYQTLEADRNSIDILQRFVQGGLGGGTSSLAC